MKAKKAKKAKKKVLAAKNSNERLMAIEPTAVYTSEETASYLRMQQGDARGLAVALVATRA